VPHQDVPRHGRRATPPVVATFAPTSDAQPAAAHGRRAASQPRSFDHSADALWAAVGARDGDEVTRLLARGADPNMICSDGVQCACSARAVRVQCVRVADLTCTRR